MLLDSRKEKGDFSKKKKMIKITTHDKTHETKNLLIYINNLLLILSRKINVNHYKKKVYEIMPHI